MRKILIATLAFLGIAAVSSITLTPEDNVMVTCPAGYYPATRVVTSDATKALLFCRPVDSSYLIDIGQSPIPTPQRMREMPKQP